MSIAILSAPSAAFTLCPDLQDPGSRGGVRRTFLDNPTQEETLLRKLGSRGWGRIQYFRSCFDTGWGENRQGMPLSPRALELFLRFVAEMDFPDSDTKPSVFLTDTGGIELCWEDANKDALQVEFTRDGAEYYVAASGIEGNLSHQELSSLPRLLSA